MSSKCCIGSQVQPVTQTLVSMHLSIGTSLTAYLYQKPLSQFLL